MRAAAGCLASCPPPPPHLLNHHAHGPNLSRPPWTAAALCRDIADTSLRLCHQEMLERAREKEARDKERRGGGSAGSETRRAMKHELARKMKRVSEFVRADMPWQEARRLMLEHGVALINDMDPRDAEQVRHAWCACVRLSTSSHDVVHTAGN